MSPVWVNTKELIAVNNENLRMTPKIKVKPV
jgi:hypothetical protein